MITCIATTLVINQGVTQGDPIMTLLEPSITGVGPGFDLYEQIVTETTIKILSECGLPHVKYLSFEEEPCLRFNLQGETDTCVYFSFYLVFLLLINGSRKMIYEVMSSMSLGDRIRELTQFIYFIYQLMKGTIAN